VNIETLQQLESGRLAGSKQLKLCCGLTEFPTAIFSLADTLEILDLSGNNLSSLPDDFARLKKLKILFLSDNNFTVFPEVLSQCESLEMIGFKANKIHSISETALPVQTRWLILTNNQLTAIPTSIGKCYWMQKLALAGNKLTALPKELSNCKNLGLLRISANALQAFPLWLLTMPKLSWLAFSGNPFCITSSTNNDLQEIPWQQLTIQNQLGEGASGIISKALWQQSINAAKEVAVKVFKGKVTSDGLPEDEMNACILAGKHENLVEVLGKIVEHPSQKEGLVLSLIPNSFYNLGLPPSFESCTRDVFAEGTSFSIQQIIKIVASIASAAAHLHVKGIIHGDLYAHNTLIDENAHTIFGDFGAASLYNTHDTIMATSLERIEVSAWGCLLEDLLNNVSYSEKNDEAIKALNQLKQAAMQPDVTSRPSFVSISNQLKQFAY
jgi:hypothetical protein